jgi:hypothetical protein
MGRYRHARLPSPRTIAATLIVAATVGIGWMFEPSDSRADDHLGPVLIVREPVNPTPAPAPLDRQPPTVATPTHAIVVDSDLDLDLDHATGPAH